jgi:TonB family protein
MTKRMSYGFFWLSLASSCVAQTTPERLCPKHVEPPTYPSIARTAHITGKVILELTLDADGKVKEVKVVNENDKWVGLLKLTAIDNVRLWTFAKPPRAAFTQTVVYDFELDDSLPGEGGPSSLPAITKVTFDLPDRVTISANVPFIDHGPGNGTPIKKRHWWQ